MCERLYTRDTAFDDDELAREREGARKRERETIHPRMKTTVLRYAHTRSIC